MSVGESRGESRGSLPPHLERRIATLANELARISDEIEDLSARDLRQPGAVDGPEPGDIPGSLVLGSPEPPADELEAFRTAAERNLSEQLELAQTLHVAAERRAVEAELAAAAATRRALAAELELSRMTPRLARAERSLAEILAAEPELALEPEPELEDSTPAPQYRAPLPGTVPPGYVAGPAYYGNRFPLLPEPPEPARLPLEVRRGDYRPADPVACDHSWYGVGSADAVCGRCGIRLDGNELEQGESPRGEVEGA